MSAVYDYHVGLSNSTDFRIVYIVLHVCSLVSFLGFFSFPKEKKVWFEMSMHVPLGRSVKGVKYIKLINSCLARPFKRLGRCVRPRVGQTRKK